MNVVQAGLDVAYPDRFHRELMPTWLHAVVTALGMAAPDITRPYRWCEIGCAGGLTARVAAATNPLGHFTGIDLDPAHIASAQQAAHDAGLSNTHFQAADVRAVAAGDTSEPGFDFIVTHGLWSWVDDDVRAAIGALIARRLAPGGLVVLGYMSHPGASQLQGLQQVMRRMAAGQPGNAAQRAEAIVPQLQRLATAGAGFFAEHPGAARQVAAMTREAPAYLAHEFLGPHWAPQHSGQVIEAMATHGVTFLGSATALENIDALSIPGTFQPLLAGAPAGPLAESLRDLARNQSLRRDIFQRDPAPLGEAAHLAALDRLTFAALPGAPAQVPADLRLDTRIGPVQVPRALADPLLQALATGPATFATLRALPAFAQAPGVLNQLLQALLWAGLVHPCRADGPHAARASLPGTGLQLLPALGSAIGAPP